ncbi:hypothetical protein J4207_05730 [Candidatus Woesearchaeota archaeon]|nr:hypothetical protein [Candidatus Woesearchaeota archaeon]
MSDCCKKSPGIDTQDKHEPRFEMCNKTRLLGAIVTAFRNHPRKTRRYPRAKARGFTLLAYRRVLEHDIAR